VNIAMETRTDLFKNHFREKTPPGTSEALGQSEVFLDFQEKLSRVAPGGQAGSVDR